MSEYGCGHEIFDYHSNGDYVQECRTCKPDAPTYSANDLKVELANQKSAILAAVKGMKRYDIKLGRSVVSGVGIADQHDGRLLERSEVLTTIREVGE